MVYSLNLIFSRWLVELNLLEPLGGQILMSLIHVRIENYIQQICKGSFDVSYVQHLEKVSENFDLLPLGGVYNKSTRF